MTHMIKTYKPTSAGMRRRKTLVVKATKKRPVKSLTIALKGPVGRSGGKITSRHKQRGARKHYRVIDFKRNKWDIPAKVASIEYDPNRGPNIALLYYADGEKRYILAPVGLEVGAIVISGMLVDATVGNSMPLKNVPLGSEVHNVEVNPGQGGKLIRGAGNSGIVMAKESKYVNIKLPSGEVKRFLADCFATIGKLGNADVRNADLGKAGRNRHLGNRPHVRGVAYPSPRDHPHGGSYKTTGIGMSSPKSPWGWKTRGKKTRKRKQTDKFIVKSRRAKR